MSQTNRLGKDESKPGDLNPIEVACPSREENAIIDNQLLDLSKLGILEPQARLKALSDSAGSFEIDYNLQAKMYYRSGREMVKMAHVYRSEGSLENAYYMYMKFMTLFLEKIRTHPGFPNVPVEDRAQNMIKLREVIPIAEKLKKSLLSIYEKQHAYFIEKQKQLLAQENEKKQKALHEDSLNKTDLSLNIMKQPAMTLELPSLDINYPTEMLELRDTSTLPSIDRSTKPSSLLMSASLKQSVLRDVIVPAVLMTKFLTLSIRNTEQNIETCGILAGTLKKNKFYITHLLIPKQTGTPDSCSAENEEEIFAFQDEHDLITLGWIHTHPSQTAFLSSVDLHTHCSYQLMLPESIAIVCSPKYTDYSIFQLTPDFGLDYVAKCRQTGFHPHPKEPPIYTIAAHAKLEDLRINVVDLRSR